MIERRERNSTSRLKAHLTIQHTIEGYIDCFEGEFAVVEFYDEMKGIPKSELSMNANVNDGLIFDGDKITVSKEKTDKINS